MGPVNRMVIKLFITTATLAAIVSCGEYAVTAQRPSESVETAKCQIPIYKGRDADRKAKILAKPEPKYTAAERREYRGESITLRAVLCGSGEVMEITVKSGVAPAVDEKAIDAARRIQFVPGQKDGQPISTLVTVLYKVK